jgi:hypothetical protein
MYGVAVGITGHVLIFRISKGWKVFFSIGALFLAVVFGRLMLEPFLGEHTHQTGPAVLLFLFGAIPLSLLAYFFPWVFKARIEVFPDRIKEIGPRTKEFLIDKIQGFRVVPTQYIRTLIILPKDSTKKKIKTALVLENQPGLFEWLNRSLPNLDAIDSQEDLNRVLADSQLGETMEQRLYVLTKAKMWSKILYVLSLAAMLWAIFRPQPYQYAVGTCIALPLVILGFVRHFHGLIRFDDDKVTTSLPNTFGPFILPCFGLALRAVADFNILDWNKFWIPFACTALLLYSLTLMAASSIRRRVGTAIGLILFCAVYGYGAVVCLNGILDMSSPTVYKAQVIEKRISSGRHVFYYLKLSQWGPRKEIKEVDVGKSVYEKREFGDIVRVIVKEGRLGIPWFYVR